jgi:hypothetical protein
MNAEKFNQIKKTAEVNAVFGDAKNFSTAKKVLDLDATINKINNWTTEKVVTFVNNHYKPILKRLPREIRGEAIKRFCDACRVIIDNNGILFALDNSGNVVPKKVLNKISKKDCPELAKLLQNLIMDATTPDTSTNQTNTDTNTKNTPILVDDLDPVTAEAVAWMLAA